MKASGEDSLFSYAFSPTLFSYLSIFILLGSRLLPLVDSNTACNLEIKYVEKSASMVLI
jgi:hypothetical protein